MMIYMEVQADFRLTAPTQQFPIRPFIAEAIELFAI